MSESKLAYRFTGMSVLYFGIAFLIVGALCYIYLLGSFLGAIGFFVGLAGVVLLVLGFVRLARERRAHKQGIDVVNR